MDKTSKREFQPPGSVDPVLAAEATPELGADLQTLEVRHVIQGPSKEVSKCALYMGAGAFKFFLESLRTKTSLSDNVYYILCRCKFPQKSGASLEKEVRARWRT